ENQQQARVAFHRTTDIAEQDQGPAAQPSLAMEQPDQLATGTDGVAGSAPEVDPSSAGRPEAPCGALGDPPGCLLQEALDLLRFHPYQLPDLLVRQHPCCTC